MHTGIFNLWFDDFFDGALKSWDYDRFKSHNKNFPSYPVSNVLFDKEKEDLIFEIAVTGFEKNEIELATTGNCLNIKAKKRDKEKENIFYIHKSLATREFDITYRIDDRQDLNNIKTKLNNGLLIIVIPVKEKEKARKIEIN